MGKPSKLRLGREARIVERVKIISKWEGYEYLKTHLYFAENTKETNRKILQSKLEESSITILEIKVLIKHLKKFVPSVLEQNKLTAIYFLITKAFFDLEATIKLVDNGFSYQAINIARSANEAIDMVFLFIEENDGKDLKKWFKGEIIPNEASRKSADKVMNSGIFGNIKFPVYELKKDVYDVYSEFTHNGYGAVLDLIDPFHKDLDFNRLTGYHFSLKYFEITIQNIEFNILLALKFVFIYLDQKKQIENIDNLLLLFSNLKASPNEVEDIMRNYS